MIKSDFRSMLRRKIRAHGHILYWKEKQEKTSMHYFVNASERKKKRERKRDVQKLKKSNMPDSRENLFALIFLKGGRNLIMTVGQRKAH